MKIEVTPKALEWFHNELTLAEGMGVRFYGKVYGSTNVHEGFSVGMSVEQPEEPRYTITIDNILFFIEETDSWFFQNYDLLVDYDDQLDEPKYTFRDI